MGLTLSPAHFTFSLWTSFLLLVTIKRLLLIIRRSKSLTKYQDIDINAFKIELTKKNKKEKSKESNLSDAISNNNTSKDFFVVKYN